MNYTNCKMHEKGEHNQDKSYDSVSNQLIKTNDSQNDGVFACASQYSLVGESNQDVECCNLRDIFEPAADRNYPNFQNFINIYNDPPLIVNTETSTHRHIAESNESNSSDVNLLDMCSFNDLTYTDINFISSECFESGYQTERYTSSRSQPKQQCFQDLAGTFFDEDNITTQRQSRISISNKVFLDSYTTPQSNGKLQSLVAASCDEDIRENCASDNLSAFVNVYSTNKKADGDVALLEENTLKLTDACSSSSLCTYRKISKNSDKIQIRGGMCHADDLYKCDFCDKAFSQQSTLKRHCTALSCIPYTCDICQRTINQICHMRMHKEKDGKNSDDRMKSHTYSKTFICDVCRKKFVTGPQLKRHRRKHSNDNEDKIYKCGICWNIFDHPHTYEKHRLTHLNVNTTFNVNTGFVPPSTAKAKKIKKKAEKKKIECDLCHKWFISISTLTRHSTTHFRDKRYHCGICRQKSDKSSAIKKHMMTHTGEKPFHCDICDKQLSTACSLRNHKTIHLGDKPFHCNFCKRFFSLNSSLKRHMQQNSANKPFKCDICGKRFIVYCALKVHMYTHPDVRPYECDMCEQKYKNCSSLIRHKRIHSPIKLYKCNICGKDGFKTLLSMTNHQQLYCDKLHKCDICEKRFVKRYTLKRHMIVHSYERPYQCDICELKYKSFGSLRRHRTIHSSNKFD